MVYGVCGVVGHGCSSFLVGCGDGSHWCRATTLLPYPILPYSMREAGRAMASVDVLIVLWCRPRSCHSCQDLAIFINVWK